MPILKIPVENADELLNASLLGAGALGRVERSATGGGAGFSEFATFALVSGTYIYTIYDLSGADTSWYRVRYSKSDGTSPSSYGDEFQAGDETGGLICSLYDVKQRTGSISSSDEETVLDLIRQVTVEIERYAKRDFTGDRSDVTFRLHTRAGRSLRIPKGIQSVTTLGVAEEDQPSSGGTYLAALTTDYYLDPPEYDRPPGWPATRIMFRRNPTGSVTRFSDASFGVQITGRRGFAEVPPDVQRVGTEMVLSAFLTKGSGEAERAVVGPSGQPVILRDPRHRAVLDGYRVPSLG